MRVQKFIEFVLKESPCSSVKVTNVDNSQLRVQIPAVDFEKKELVFQIFNGGLWEILNGESDLKNMTVIELVTFMLTKLCAPIAKKNVNSMLQRFANQEMYDFLIIKNEIFMTHGNHFKLMNASGALLDTLHFEDGQWIHQSAFSDKINYYDHFELFNYVEQEKSLVAGINTYLKATKEPVVPKQVMEMIAVFDIYGTSVIHYTVNDNLINIRFEGSDMSYDMIFMDETWTVISKKSEKKFIFLHTAFVIDTNLRKLYLEILDAL